MDLNIKDLLEEMVRQGASDLHAKAGSPPGYRISGKIVPQTQYGILTPQNTMDLVRQLVNDEQWEKFEVDRDLDFSYALPGVARFRVNALTQRTASGLVIRQIPDKIPTAAELGVPDICLELALKPRGLVLVTGPTGSGKSTTLAAMINHINENESGHILTMEDPLEFIHPDKQCYITQRQIGQDCKSFSEGLRRALRQDPDVILIGEMRDLETISMAITAAETGHLVFGTLHTTSAISTVDRIIDVFPTDAQQQVRVQLASTLQGVISQCLVPKVGGGRCAAREILIGTDGVKSLVREGKTAQILNLIQTGKSSGMVTLEAELQELVKQQLITPQDALSKANRVLDLAKQLGIDPRTLPDGGSNGAGAGGTTAGRGMPGMGGGERTAGARREASRDAGRSAAPASRPTGVRPVKGGGLFGKR